MSGVISAMALWLGQSSTALRSDVTLLTRCRRSVGASAMGFRRATVTEAAGAGSPGMRQVAGSAGSLTCRRTCCWAPSLQDRGHRVVRHTSRIRRSAIRSRGHGLPAR
jgi:hypothetical protein